MIYSDFTEFTLVEVHFCLLLMLEFRWFLTRKPRSVKMLLDLLVGAGCFLDSLGQVRTGWHIKTYEDLRPQQRIK